MPDALDRAEAAITILTPSVTRYLPEGWQGGYNHDRALDWLAKRESESELLLATRRDSGQPAGFLVVLTDDASRPGETLRIGFALAQSAWSQGLGAEMLSGFIDYCRENDVREIIGGVEDQNEASQRLLLKCGFQRRGGDGTVLEYRLNLDR